MFKGLRSQRLLALFAAGAFALNFPLVALWDRAGTVAGIPAAPALLFALWAAIIAALARLADPPG
jgi:hypothetical protein